MAQFTSDWRVGSSEARQDEYGRVHHPRGNGSPVNVAGWERWASAIGGGSVLLAGLATRRPLVGLVAALTGGAFLYRGTTGHCPMYGALGIDTTEHKATTAVPAQQGCKVEETITVDRPREELFRFWRNLENLPQIMRHIERIEVLDDRRSKWTARGPLGTSVEWEAEIFNERENELIAWRSVEGSEVQTAGSVHFDAPGNRGTVVRVSLKYNPPAGKVGASVAALLGESVESQIREDLCRYKSTLEAGEAPTTHGQASGGT